MKTIKTILCTTIVLLLFMSISIACNKQSDRETNYHPVNMNHTDVKPCPKYRPYVLYCDNDHSPIHIDDGCFCPLPCVNCMETLIIRSGGSGTMAQNFVNAFNNNDFNDFFGDTGQWHHVFPVEAVGEDFGTQVINGDIKFIAAAGIQSNSNDSIYIALLNEAPSNGFGVDDVVIALPINKQK